MSSGNFSLFISRNLFFFFFEKVGFIDPFIS